MKTFKNLTDVLSSAAWVACGLLVSLFLLAAPELNAAESLDPLSAPRGYSARGCGFDLDDDGLIGEPDDCRVCNADLVDGRIAGGSIDPDNDGIQEDLLYVDCDGGLDQRRCGQPGQRPCRSLGFALQKMSGPSDGAEDIVCFTGTCRGEENLTPRFGGLAGVRVAPAEGSQSRSFEFARDPAMIVGWDRDRDGVYPPFDPDDTSVLDAGMAGQAFLFNTKGANNSYFEMAHFTARDYGRRNPGEDGGFLKLGDWRPASHLYLHDLSLQNINRDQPSKSGRITFNFFGLGVFRYAAFVNLDVPDNGGYLNRGAAPYAEPSAGPFRWQNVTVSAHSCDQEGPEACPEGAFDAYWTGWKLWGYFEGLEVLDSVIDANLSAWKPKREGGPVGAQGVVAGECSVDWMIRNNAFREVKTAFKVQNYAENFCDAPKSRPVERVVFDGNLVRNDSNWWKNGLIAIASGAGGAHASETNGSITISNNRLHSSVGWDTTVDLETGNGESISPGGISLLGNVFSGFMRTDESAFLRVRSQQPFKQHRDGIILRGNTFCGAGEGKQNIRTTFSVDDWQATGNSYAAEGHFAWAGKRALTISSWRALSGQDEDAKVANCSDLSGTETGLRNESAKPVRP